MPGIGPMVAYPELEMDLCILAAFLFQWYPAIYSTYPVIQVP